MDQVDSPNQDGTYSSDVSTWPVGTGIGDGSTAPQFDGTNDYNDVFSATLQGAFNGEEGTISVWAKVSGSGVWTDGARREVFRILDTTDYQELIWIEKNSTNNQLWYRYIAAGTIENVYVSSVSDTR